ncbi:MAG: transcriptional regulator [Pseudomonadota bacterium]
MALEMHDAKRVEIIIEAPMERRFRAALEAAEITGYTVMPVRGGSGRSGDWTREGQISSAGGMRAVICILKPERLDDLIEKVFPILERHIGVVSITDCKVLRAERF